MNPDQLAELEEERRFLLTSITDLEREHAAGDVDDADYQALHDGYVARAAAILREIEDGTEPPAPAGRRRWGRVAVGVVIVLVVAGLAGWLVARESGQRLPGQSLTGGQTDESSTGLLSQARAINFTDPVKAIELYSQVLELDPDNVEALTYRAWLLALSSRGASSDVQQLAIEQARTDLRRAVELDPAYPDPHCFLGIIAFRFESDAAAAKPELEACQASNPPAEVQSFVDSVVAEVDAALGS